MDPLPPGIADRCRVGQAPRSTVREPQISHLSLSNSFSIPQPWHLGISLNNRCAMKPANNNMHMVNTIQCNLQVQTAGFDFVKSSIRGHFSIRWLHVHWFIVPPTRIISTCFRPYRKSESHKRTATIRARATGVAIGLESMTPIGYSRTLPFASRTSAIFCLNCASRRTGRFSGDNDNTYATSAQRSPSFSKLSRYEGIGVPFSPPLKVR